VGQKERDKAQRFKIPLRFEEISQGVPPLVEDETVHVQGETVHRTGRIEGKRGGLTLGSSIKTKKKGKQCYRRQGTDVVRQEGEWA